MAQKRNRSKQTASFEERLAEEAQKCKAAADKNLAVVNPGKGSWGAPGRWRLHHKSTDGLALPD